MINLGRILVLILLGGFSATQVYGRVVKAQEDPPTVGLNPASTIAIDSVIGEDNLLAVGKQLLVLSTSLESVDIIIHSPGGSVETGFMFISMMDEARASGLHLRCFVPMMAASMAFSILSHCDERLVLDHSLLMFHRARVFVGGRSPQVVTAPTARNLAEELSSLDRTIYSETVDALGIDKQIVLKHFLAETLHQGRNLCTLAPDFCTSYPSIPGLISTLLNPKVIHTKKQSGFFRDGDESRHRIHSLPRYISSESLEYWKTLLIP